ncbi:MAG: DotA/TraY family protein, partial [Azonexus sp.]|uniref:DotA/TraY family protein n=1 Tax=Azonexus sp. TaxID=1872668 RepID=UPI00281FFD74
MRRFPFFAFALSLALFFPALAFAEAAGTGFMHVVDTDVTVGCFLNPLFGSLVDMPGAVCAHGGGSGDPMSGIIGQLNTAILIVGGVLLSYGLIVGTMQTAHDGELLGKRWSSMWVPIRTSVGTAFIVPLGQGYCVIQYLVMWMVLQGIGAANLIWGEYATHTADTLPPMSAMIGTAKGNQIGVTVLRQELCAAVLNGEVEKAKKDPTMKQAILTYLGDEWPTFAIKTVDSEAELDTNDKVCGVNKFVDLNKTKDPSLSTEFIGAVVTGSNLPARIQSWFGNAQAAQEFQAAIDAEHQAALVKLQGKLRPIAQAIYASADEKSTANFQQQIGAAIDAYNQQLAAKAKAFFDATNNPSAVAQNATKDGWGSAGA